MLRETRQDHVAGRDGVMRQQRKHLFSYLLQPFVRIGFFSVFCYFLGGNGLGGSLQLLLTQYLVITPGQELNLGQLHARQAPYWLYYHFGLSVFSTPPLLTFVSAIPSGSSFCILGLIPK